MELGGLLLAAILFLAGQILKHQMISRFTYGPYCGQRAVQAYHRDLALCQAEGDDQEIMIREQPVYWRQRDACLLLRNAALIIVLFLMVRFLFFTEKQVRFFN